MQPIYLFDLDGTLIDSMPTGVGIVLDFLDEHGVKYPDNLIKTLTPLGYKGVAKYYAEQLGVPMSPEQIYAVFQAKTLKAYGESIPLKDGVKQTLVALKEKGCRLCVLTASPNNVTELCLKRLQVFDLFEFVWSIDDFQLTKADEEIYRQAAQRLGVDTTDCVMVDDNVRVLQTAQRTGMKTIGVYDDSAQDMQEEMCACADGYAKGFSQIMQITF